jgi:predicted nucleic acid-binding protein
MMALLDTNILIRFLTSDKTKKFRGVYTLFESLERGDLRVELKLIVLFQVIFVLVSCLINSVSDNGKIISKFLA